MDEDEEEWTEDNGEGQASDETDKSEDVTDIADTNTSAHGRTDFGSGGQEVRTAGGLSAAQLAKMIANKQRSSTSAPAQNAAESPNRATSQSAAGDATSPISPTTNSQLQVRIILFMFYDPGFV
jgi:hypothetical protein